MSHRDSDSRRHRSGFDRESSPKRSRRDGKPTAEREPNDSNLDSRAHMDRDQKHRRRLQEALPLEASSAPDSKVESGVASKDSDKKLSDKPSSDHSRSKSFFQQHDERAGGGQVDRNNGRKAAERGWWKRAETEGERDKKSEAKDGDATWRHDKFSDVKTDPPSPVRKRPAFREKKLPVDSDGKQSHHDRPFSVNEKREDRRQFDRPRRPPGREMQRERYGGGNGNYRGRDRPSGGGRPARHDKWSHDLFDEANKSPPRKNEDEQIAKVESLLAL